LKGMLIKDSYESIVKSCYRSIIVSDEYLDGIDDSLCYVTRVATDFNYVSLTDEGVLYVLRQSGVSDKLAQNILEFILNREELQVSALQSYLEIERNLNESIVFIYLGDGTVSTDEKMFRKTYCLPLDKLFKSIVGNGFKPVRTDTQVATLSVKETDYSKYLFANKHYNKLLTLFIDVT